MTTAIFVNLPVKDLAKAIAFFTKLGYTFDAQFTNDRAGCLIINEYIYAMLVTEPLFKGFINNKEICNTAKYAESILALSLNNKEDVNQLVHKALEAGGTASGEPQQHGDYMYQWGFCDLDGHLWEVFFMDKSKFPIQ